MKLKEIRQQCLVVLRPKNPVSGPEREALKTLNDKLNTLVYQRRLAEVVAECLTELELEDERLPSREQHS